MQSVNIYQAGNVILLNKATSEQLLHLQPPERFDHFLKLCAGMLVCVCVCGEFEQLTLMIN